MNKRLLFLNPMSRNGTSLIYQLLFGHPQIDCFPGRIQFGCSHPVGWPFFGFEEEPVRSFFHKMNEKTTLPINISANTEWHNMQIDYIKNIHLTELKDLESSFVKDAHKISSTVKSETLNEFVNLYISKVSELLSLTREPELNTPSYNLIFDDHNYNLGTENILKHYPEAQFIQMIRNSKDIIASRKNMLLFHLGFEGDPSSKTLKDSVIISELRRTLWNFFAAHLNQKRNNDIYHVIKFENLRGEDRKSIMKSLSEKLEIEFNDSLTVENKSITTRFANELLLVSASLKKITSGKINKKVNSHKITLNACELQTIDDFMENFTGLFKEDIKIDDLTTELKMYFESNLENIEKDPILSGFLKLYNEKKWIDLFKHYSKLNFGGSKAAVAFE
jgi:hypothetical protein